MPGAAEPENKHVSDSHVGESSLSRRAFVKEMSRAAAIPWPLGQSRSSAEQRVPAGERGKLRVEASDTV